MDLVISDKVDDIREIIDEYPYIDENCIAYVNKELDALK